MADPVSVVMPVYNAAPFLERSIASILSQTFGDFELVIRDDGSTDGSSQILDDWARRDSRIRLYHSGENLGPVGSSNWVAARASFPLVARMDADDEAYPDRLQRQVEVLRQRPEIGLLGTLYDSIDGEGRTLLPANRFALAGPSDYAPFAHGSIMFRREIFERVGGYREACVFWEDLDLYVRFARETRVATLADVLYRFRYAVTSTRITSRQDDLERAMDLMLECAAEASRGRDYDRILAAAATRCADRGLHPRVFLSIGQLRLWVGQSPRVFGAICRRARLAPDRETAMALLWAAWADLAPQTLRAYIGWLTRRLNASVSDKIVPGGLYDWPAG